MGVAMVAATQTWCCRAASLKEIAAVRFSDFEDVVRESNMLFLVETRDGVGFPESFHRKIEANHASG